MKRFRLPILGCLGLIALAGALVAIPVATTRSPYESGRTRWSAKGGGDYTLVITQYCFCGPGGDKASYCC